MEEDIKKINRFITIMKSDFITGLNYKYELEAIEHLIKGYKELEEEIKKINKQLDLDYVDKTYIPVSLVEEKITQLKEQYNKVVNEVNNQGMIDQLIDFKEVSTKLEMCEELLEKR